MIVDGAGERRALEMTCDYVIVGSGAAGATVARVLADTGASLVVLEEGPAVATEQFGDRLFPALRQLFRGRGAQMARGRAALPIVQGCCLGGSTVVNSAIVWRIPEDVWEPWQQEYGLGDALPLAALHRHWDQIEQELQVQPTPRAVWGENNRLMDVARAELQISAAPTRRNAPGCRGSARCLTGCPHGAKQSMLVSYLPYAAARGATIVTSARVDRVRWRGDRAVGVQGRLGGAGAAHTALPVTVHARQAVVVAASAVQTPGLLRRSGVRSPHLGRHFQGHPGAMLAGLFDHPVGLWNGATQGFDADEHRADGRYKVETLALPPEMVLASLPGVGHRWLASMAEAPHLALWGVQLRAFAQGAVRERVFGTDITFDLEERDMVNLRAGLRFTAELLFAVGARAVLPGIHGLPERLTHPAQAALLETGPADPAAYALIMSHLFGTARMSNRPADGVVGPDFGVHARRGLYVVDSSVFPTNLGVNPQHPIMGVAMHAAHRIAEGRR